MISWTGAEEGAGDRGSRRQIPATARPSPGLEVARRAGAPELGAGAVHSVRAGATSPGQRYLQIPVEKSNKPDENGTKTHLIIQHCLCRTGIHVSLFFLNYLWGLIHRRRPELPERERVESERESIID